MFSSHKLNGNWKHRELWNLSKFTGKQDSPGDMSGVDAVPWEHRLEMEGAETKSEP